MNYSFTISAPTKSEAVEKVFTALVEVTTTQPVHGADSKQAYEAAQAFIAVLAEPSEEQEVMVMVSGSLSWFDGDADKNPPLNTAAVSINAALIQLKV